MFGLTTAADLRLLALRALAGLAIVSLVVGGIYLKGRADGRAVIQARFDAFVMEVKEQTARVQALGLERIIKTQKAQNDVTVQILDRTRSDYAALDARYDGLWARFHQDRTKPVPVPSASQSSDRFTVCAKDPGLFCISPSAAIALMKTADETVVQLENLIAWNKAQAGVTVELPEEIN